MIKKLSTEQLNNSCKCSNFLGVFPLNRLPVINNANEMFVVNTDTDNLPEQHWIAVKGNRIFDRIGYYYPTMLVKHMYKYYDNLDINYDAFQNPMEQSCGYYCIYFLHYLTIDLIPNAFDFNLRIILSTYMYCA